MLLLLGLGNPHQRSRDHGPRHGAGKAEPPDGAHAVEADGAVGKLVDADADAVADAGEDGAGQVLHRDQQAARRPLVAARHGARDEDGGGREAHVGPQRRQRHARHAQGPVRRRGRLREEKGWAQGKGYHGRGQDPVSR